MSSVELNPGLLEVGEIKIPVPWGHISGKTWGKPLTGQPVLAIHGLTDNAGSFDKLIPLLHRSLYVVAIELPGHGRSSHLPIGFPYHILDFVTTIRRAVNHLAWKKFWCIGHSLGGVIGILYTTMYPDEVEGFVSLDQMKPLTDSVDECAAKLSDGINGFLALDKIQQRECSGLKKGIPYEMTYQRMMDYARNLNFPLTESAAKTLCIRGTTRINSLEWTYNRDQRAAAVGIVKFSHQAYLDFVRELRPRVLAITTREKTGILGPTDLLPAQRSYEKSCESFEVIELEGNHFLHLNNPEQLAGKINKFFQPS